MNAFTHTADTVVWDSGFHVPMAQYPLNTPQGWIKPACYDSPCGSTIMMPVFNSFRIKKLYLTHISTICLQIWQDNENQIVQQYSKKNMCKVECSTKEGPDMSLTPVFNSFSEVCHSPSCHQQSATFELNKFSQVICTFS